MSSSQRKGPWYGINAVVVAAALLPVLWIVVLSLKKPADVLDGRVIPKTFSLENYRNIFEQDIFTSALANSLIIAAVATVIAVALAAMAAYAIARLEFPGKGLILGAALAIAMFPAISIVGPLFNMWRALGLFDTKLGLIIPDLTFALPLAIYTMSAFFREIPWELEQAAQVDGATPAVAFRKVMVPLATPAVFTTAIIVFIMCWNDFVFAVSLSSTSNAQTVPAALSQFSGASQFQAPYGSIAAAAVIVTIPIIIIVLIFQRRIVAGLTSGAVKG